MGDMRAKGAFMPDPSPLRRPWLLALVAVLVTFVLALAVTTLRDRSAMGDGGPTVPSTGY